MDGRQKDWFFSTSALDSSSAHCRFGNSKCQAFPLPREMLMWCQWSYQDSTKVNLIMSNFLTMHPKNHAVINHALHGKIFIFLFILFSFSTKKSRTAYNVCPSPILSPRYPCDLNWVEWPSVSQGALWLCRTWRHKSLKLESNTLSITK